MVKQDVVRALEGLGVEVQAVEVSEDGARVAVRAMPADTMRELVAQGLLGREDSREPEISLRS